MQERQLYEYAVIRVMPRVEREEFLNVGVVLYCSSKKYLEAVYVVNHQRLSAFCNSCDTGEIETYLIAFKNICMGNGNAGPISLLPAAARFRWLTATRSTVVQTSKTHPGLCLNPADMLLKLFKDLVE
jgi:hypothetical protein